MTTIKNTGEFINLPFKVCEKCFSKEFYIFLDNGKNYIVCSTCGHPKQKNPETMEGWELFRSERYFRAFKTPRSMALLNNGMFVACEFFNSNQRRGFIIYDISKSKNGRNVGRRCQSFDNFLISVKSFKQKYRIK